MGGWEEGRGEGAGAEQERSMKMHAKAHFKYSRLGCGRTYALMHSVFVGKTGSGALSTNHLMEVTLQHPGEDATPLLQLVHRRPDVLLVALSRILPEAICLQKRCSIGMPRRIMRAVKFALGHAYKSIRNKKVCEEAGLLATHHVVRHTEWFEVLDLLGGVPEFAKQVAPILFTLS